MAFLQPFDQRQDLRLRRDVERRCRLIGDQNVWFERQRHGDDGALALTTRKLVRIAFEDPLRFVQAHLAQEADRARFHIEGAAFGMGGESFADLRANRRGGVQRRGGFLADHGDSAAAIRPQPAFGEFREIQAAEQDAPTGHADAPWKKAQHRPCDHGFARAAFADEAGGSAPAQGDVHPIDRQIAVAAAGQRDHGFAHL